MRLSISNIGWTKEQDEAVYSLMQKYRYKGLEIAPTRIFPESPYEKKDEAKIWAESLKNKYGFEVPSMQSIWYGRQEKLFGTEEERLYLIEYTKRAIDFAEAIGCKNLVFGCPRNRYLPEGVSSEIAVAFFRKIGDYAAEHGTRIGMEANPTIYNTNYINDTTSALELIKKVDSEGFLLNLDVGTMIQNHEDMNELTGNVKYINHVHISEPGLKPIESRGLHKDLQVILKNENYQGFVSIEMGKVDSVDEIMKKISYVRTIFSY